jgi:predicted RNA-binding Zn-ribbon protein involved in translation (DUF1610 family)
MSSNFRIKKKVSKVTSNIKASNTLEKKHLNKIKTIETKKKSLEKLKKELNKITKELNILEEKRNNNILIDLDNRAKLLINQEELFDTINEIEKDNDEINYYDLTGDLLIEYYELKNDIPIQNEPAKNILEFINLKNTSIKNDNNKKNKSDLFNKYCERVDGIRLEKDDGKNRIKYCTFCNVEKILEVKKSSYICPECGLMEYIILDEDNMIKDYSPYQRKNHFKEWLNQFQAKETTEIPESVFTNIKTELEKYRIEDYTKITRDTMQVILKKLGYNKLYEHNPFIINKITGIPAPKISRDIEETFINMFMKIQEPWEIYKPKGRKNFLSYPFILYKFSELLELDYLLPYFPLLKPEKLKEHDIIWEKFCKHLNWEFYATT